MRTATKQQLKQRGNTDYWAEIFLRYLGGSAGMEDSQSFKTIQAQYEQLSDEQIEVIKHAIGEYKAKIMDIAHCQF